MEQKLCPGCEEPVIDKVPGCPLQCGTVQCKAFKKKPVYDFEIMPIVWVIGGPGSGKAEQSRQISNFYGLIYLSVGEMLRAEMARGTERARCFNSVMGRGGLVPNDVVLGFLKKAIEEGAANNARGFVVDGFPREKSQGFSFERFVGPASLILYLEASAETMFNKIKDRRKAPGRVDENMDAMKLRLETFMKHNDSVYELYKYRLVKINANETPEKIAAQIRGTMDVFMKNVDALKAKKALEARKAEEAKKAEQAKRDAYVMPAKRGPKSAEKESKPGSAKKKSSTKMKRTPSQAGTLSRTPSRTSSRAKIPSRTLSRTETPSKPGSPATSGSPTKPGSPAKPGGPATPGSPTKPESPSKPGSPAKPGITTKPGGPKKPGAPTKPGSPT